MCGEPSGPGHPSEEGHTVCQHQIKSAGNNWKCPLNTHRDTHTHTCVNLLFQPHRLMVAPALWKLCLLLGCVVGRLQTWPTRDATVVELWDRSVCRRRSRCLNKGSQTPPLPPFALLPVDPCGPVSCAAQRLSGDLKTAYLSVRPLLRPSPPPSIRPSPPLSKATLHQQRCWNQIKRCLFISSVTRQRWRLVPLSGHFFHPFFRTLHLFSSLPAAQSDENRSASMPRHP